MAAFGDVFRRGQAQPVGFTDEDDPAAAQTLRQKADGTRDAPADPRRADAGRHIDLFRGDVARGIAVHERHPVGDAELLGAALCLLGE